MWDEGKDEREGEETERGAEVREMDKGKLESKGVQCS